MGKRWGVGKLSVHGKVFWLQSPQMNLLFLADKKFTFHYYFFAYNFAEIHRSKKASFVNVNIFINSKLMSVFKFVFAGRVVF